MNVHAWDLTLQFALKDFKIRYTNSVLGYVWSVLHPLVFTLVYFVVFSIFVRFQIAQYPAYLLLGVVMWNFFAESTSSGTGSLLQHAGILSKVAMPRVVPVCAAILNAVFSFAISLLILMVLLLVSGAPVGRLAILFPIDVLDLVMLSLGISLCLSTYHARYHDVGYLWGLAVQIGFWLTPIIYNDGVVPEGWRWLMMFNPVARIVTESRQLLIYDVFPGVATMLETFLMCAAVLGLGVVVFRRRQSRIVESF